MSKGKYIPNHLKFRVISDIHFKVEKRSNFTLKYSVHVRDEGKRNLFGTMLQQIVVDNSPTKSPSKVNFFCNHKLQLSSHYLLNPLCILIPLSVFICII